MRTALSLIIPALCFSCVSSEAAQAAPKQAPAVLDDGCPATVAELPGAWYLDRNDARLRSKNLIVVLKSKRRVALFSGGEIRRIDAQDRACWHAALSVGPGTPSVGAKHVRGDRRTPEGWYRTSDKPRSQWYSPIAIHYPNASDAARGYQAGLIDRKTYAAIADADRRHQKPPQGTALGSDVLFHGGGGWNDWTWGCVGLDDEDIDTMRSMMEEDVRTWTLILP